ncbi:hypothetical protein COU60_04390 [Candidatus Pacearchaeota archaeon CG10_big_fil_rev_8_21_14_0_10_34_76]|nr:MAG: hypothetical protein COU60_04390 [Candidatus Pacearchaeota archaeon CG10_big_fil_rev_8_21_14_0_10_34_76]
MKIVDLPLSSRPRERFLSNGANALKKGYWARSGDQGRLCVSDVRRPNQAQEKSFPISIF